jgi:hypothetical protein
VVRDSGCDEVGLLRLDAHEYPLWVLLAEAGQGGGSSTSTCRTRRRGCRGPLGPFAPCAVVALAHYAGSPPAIEVGGEPFGRVWYLGRGERPVAAAEPAGGAGGAAGFGAAGGVRMGGVRVWGWLLAFTP